MKGVEGEGDFLSFFIVGSSVELNSVEVGSWELG